MKTNSIKEYARLNNVPIITDEGLEFILEMIKKNKIVKVLEIGTAIGYSSISFAMNGCTVTSIERNENMYELALMNIKNQNLEKQINVVYADALLIEDLDDNFDLIFIDAAKAQYEKFFNKFKKNLKKDGIIICDNLNFHNLEIDKVSRSTRQLIKKINLFKEFLKENKEFKTKFFNIGDGMSVSKR